MFRYFLETANFKPLKDSRANCTLPSVKKVSLGPLLCSWYQFRILCHDNWYIRSLSCLSCLSCLSSLSCPSCPEKNTLSFGHCPNNPQFWPNFPLKFDSLILKTHCISLWRVSKMHFSCPFCGCKWSSGGTGLLQMIIQRGWKLANNHPEGSSSKRRNWGF